MTIRIKLPREMLQMLQDDAPAYIAETLNRNMRKSAGAYCVSRIDAHVVVDSKQGVDVTAKFTVMPMSKVPRSVKFSADDFPDELLSATSAVVKVRKG